MKYPSDSEKSRPCRSRTSSKASIKWTPLSATPIGVGAVLRVHDALAGDPGNVGLMSRKNWFIDVVDGNETSSSGGT